MTPTRTLDDQSEPAWQRVRQRPGLGTFVEIGVAGAPTLATADSAIDAGYVAIETVQRLLSFHDPDSDLSRLNRTSGQASEVHPLTRRALYLARQMTLASGGLFNCTIGGSVVAQGALPDHGVTYVAKGKPDHMVFGEKTVCLMGNILVTLDGIAKGFAVDMAIKALKRAGIGAAYVNAGGDLRIYGPLATIVYRRELDGTLTPLGALQDAAIATSQSGGPDLDRFKSVLINPNGGPPLLGVWTVLAKQAWRADALTKVAALCAPRQRTKLMENLRGRWVE